MFLPDSIIKPSFPGLRGLALALLAGALLAGRPVAAEGANGQAAHNDLLIGFHYCDMGVHEGRRMEKFPLNIWPYFNDYLEYMDDEVRLTSFADFWRWWYVFERYKGDEKGLEEFDKMLDQCLERGVKVQATIAWNTWWTQNRDWEEGYRLPVAPQDRDEWIHLCELLGRRFRGRVALWNLQGEANNLEHYWEKATMEHVYDIYKTGYQGFKRGDPGTLVGVCGASPSVPVDKMDEWYWLNLSNTTGYYDATPINFFSDVADPYKGGLNFYKSIDAMLKKLGQKDAEVVMGESSIQWLEQCEKINESKLSMELQAIRCNEIYGGLFDAGMNKSIFWWTEFAPNGGHWPWRWGYRNFEDWWGYFPQDFKVPGTQIVYRYKSEDGQKDIDLRPLWPRPADPYYPAYEVYRFWVQAAPAGAESMRLALKTEGPQGTVWKLGAFQRARNEAIALVYNETEAPLGVSLDLRPTGWAEGSRLAIEASNEAISYKTGEHTPGWKQSQASQVANQELALKLPVTKGFTTIRIRLAEGEPDAAPAGLTIPAEVEVGQTAMGFVAVRNTGDNTWSKRGWRLETFGAPTPGTDADGKALSYKLPARVAPGQTVAIPVFLPAPQAEGHYYFPLRMRNTKGEWIGPVIGASFKAVEKQAPRKLVAHREVGHVRLQWFAPRADGPVARYEIERAPGFEQPFQKLAETAKTEYLDASVEPDKAYYYRVTAVDAQGRRSRPSTEDNARAISKPRIMDAEIVAHNVPATVRVGDTHTVKVTVKNTGTKVWDLSRPQAVQWWLQPTQLWERRNEKQFGRLELAGAKMIEPGQSVTVEFPYVGRKPGRFENHWIMSMEVPGTKKEDQPGWEQKVQFAYFGTPLLVETVVVNK